MNEIKHIQIVIDLDTWQPFEKQANQDIDGLIGDLKAKKLLRNCGNVKLVLK